MVYVNGVISEDIFYVFRDHNRPFSWVSCNPPRDGYEPVEKDVTYCTHVNAGYAYSLIGISHKKSRAERIGLDDLKSRNLRVEYWIDEEGSEHSSPIPEVIFHS